MQVLDYVLNDAGLREIDALEAAVERRRKDLTASSGIISLDPARAAREMSGAVQKSIDGSMESIRATFRNFAVDLIRKEAPELSEAQMAELVDSWIPDRATRPGARDGTKDGARGGTSDGFREGAGNTRYSGLARKGLVNGIPSEAMGEMVVQFVAYSSGRMPLAEEAALRDALGDWAAIYWKRFPAELQALIRDFLEGGYPEDAFLRDLETLLG